MKRKPEDISDRERWKNACQIWFCPENELISNDLQDMPRIKRELVWADLSGNSNTTIHYENESQRETPENVFRALQELGAEIAKMPTFTALKRAQTKCPAYVDDSEFQMQFLRCERFHAKNAANRMLRHFEEKKLLFGEERLGRHIEITDLNRNDLACLESGVDQILPTTDKGGRRIMFVRPATVYKERMNFDRARWYMIMDAVKGDENVQKLGLVKILYLLDQNHNKYSMDISQIRRNLQIDEALPFRTAATYVVMKPLVWDSAINACLKAFRPGMRARTRLLSGSHQECVYHLLCLGVPSDCMPVSEEGVMDMSFHQDWFAKKQQEGEDKTKSDSESDDDDDEEVLRDAAPSSKRRKHVDTEMMEPARLKETAV